MSRIAAIIFACAGSSLATADEPPLRVLEAGRLVSSPAAAVESRVAESARYMMIFRRDEFELNEPAFLAGRDGDLITRAEYDEQGRPKNKFGILVKHSGRSEAALNLLLLEEKLKESRIERLSREIAALQQSMDTRTAAKQREAIEQMWERASRFKNQWDELAADAVRYTAAAQEYRTYLALSANAAPNADETRTLRRMARAYAQWGENDLRAFAAAAERQAAALMTRARQVERISFQQAFFAARLTAQLPKLTPRQEQDQRRDDAEMAVLQQKFQQKLLERTPVKAVLPDRDDVREAYLLDLWILYVGPYNLEYYAGEAADGRIRFAAYRGQYGMLSVGAEGGRVCLSGTNPLRISVAEISKLEKLAPDLTATVESFRNGREVVLARADGTFPGSVTMPDKSMEGYNTFSLRVTAATDVDFREFESQRTFIHASGSGRYLFSNRTDRTHSRLILNQSDTRSGSTPLVISLPADTKLTTGQIQLSRNDFTLLLDCMVTTNQSAEQKLNVDIEVRRTDGTAGKFALYRGGECQFKSNDAFLQAIDAHRVARE